MTEALVPAGWTIYGTRCRCQCHRLSGIRHFIACCSEKRDAPVAKSILSEQREADEALCWVLEALAGDCEATDGLEGSAPDVRLAVQRIRALSEALQEACHERDGLLVPEWQPIETAPKDGTRILALCGEINNLRGANLSGRIFQIRHEGTMANGYDLGWAVFPGFGGVSDDWFVGWMPTPPLPTPPGEK